MPQISSKDNPLLKEFRSLGQKKHRKELSLFPAEGLRLAEEACKSSWDIAYAFIAPGFIKGQRAEDLVKALLKRAVPVYALTDERLINWVSETKAPQGIALAVKIPVIKPKNIAGSFKSMVLMADSISDPGNLGALFRTALAAGADGLITTPGSADCYNPKVVRATMGAIFNLPFYEAKSNQEALSILSGKGLNIFIAAGEGNFSYTKADFSSPFALIMGSEARGVGDFWRNKANAFLSLPMENRVESLNVSVAAGIFLYEARRQRAL